MDYKPIPYKAKYSQLTSQIKYYVSNIENWNYDKALDEYSIFKYTNVTYIGTYHITNSNDTLLDTIRNEFISLSQKEKPVVLVEDWEILPFSNVSDSIQSKGERGFLMYLGQEFNIEVIPIDYKRSIIYQHLLIKYGLDETNLFVFLYLVKNKFMYLDLSLMDYKIEILENVRNKFEWAGLNSKNITYEYLNEKYKSCFKASIFDEKDKSSFEYLNPVKNENIYSKMFKQYHSIRDENFIYQIIVNAFEGNSVMVVLGQDHALFSNNLLTSILKQN